VSGTPPGLFADAEGGVWSLIVVSEEFERLRAAFRVSAAVRRGGLVEARLVGRERPHPAAMPVSPTIEEAYLLFTDSGALVSG
jgi:hypothetical protein